MVTLYLGSSDTYSGKTLASIVLGLRWQRRGKQVGYCKPIGPMPATVGGATTDEDALFVARSLGLKTSPSDLCPIVLSPNVCEVSAAAARARVLEAFSAASQGVEVMIVSGIGALLTRGSILDLNGVVMAGLLEAKVVLTAKCESYLDADSIIACKAALGDRLLGVILNQVPVRLVEEVRATVLPCLEAAKVPVLGLLPMDPVLHAVSVKEIAAALQGQYLCSSDADEELVENFVVGAMEVDHALRYFRQTPRKCVITGGDRGDLQLAALETPTRCLILTGDLQPSQTVLAKAQQLGVPTLLVKHDTLHTINIIETLLSKLRVRSPQKIEHAMKEFETHLDLAALDRALGLA
jgi:uncharacterized protein